MSTPFHSLSKAECPVKMYLTFLLWINLITTGYLPSFNFLHFLNTTLTVPINDPNYDELILRYILYEVNLGGITYSDSDVKREFFRTFYDIINEKLTGTVRDATLTAFISEMLNNNNNLAEEYYS